MDIYERGVHYYCHNFHLNGPFQIDKENIKPVSQLLEREECPPYFFQISVLQKQEKEGQAEEANDEDNSKKEEEEAEEERSVSPPELKDPVSSPYFRWILYHKV